MKTISKVFRILATGAVSMMLAACYGTPMAGTMPDGQRSVGLKTKNSSDEPIGGIRVTFVPFEGETQIVGQTDQTGDCYFDYNINDGDTLHLEDIDGLDNGGDFQTLEMQIPAENDQFEVELTEKPGV